MTEAVASTRAATGAPPPAPTLDDIRGWPAVVPAPWGAAAAGVSRSGFYELIKTGECPFRVLHVGGRVRIITSSILDALGATDAA